ncbi:hypothetical protein OAS03_01740 [Planktomarina temperata]|nr:hypothetical protein [Planktomarina temperata]
MTIQQHASFDSSAAELNATSKLVKAWESKNAKNAAKAGGVSLMALSLAACGGSSTTPVADAPAVADPVVPVVDAPQAKGLTSQTDILTLGSGDDTINGSSTTFQSDDVLNGGAGADTLSVSAAGAGTVIANISNIETVKITNGGASNTDYAVNLIGATGVTEVMSRLSTGEVSFDNVGAAATVTAFGTQASSLTTAGFLNALASGTADSVSLKVDGGANTTFKVSGTTATNEFETVNIESAGAIKNTIAGLKDSAGNNTASTKTVNITGAADLDITLAGGASAAAVSSADATGNVKMVWGGNFSSLTGGAGSDTFDVSAGSFLGSTAPKTVIGGEGTDTIVFAEDVTALTSNTAATPHSVSGIETLEIENKLADGGSVDQARTVEADLIAGITKIAIDASNADATAGGVGGEDVTVTVNDIGSQSVEIKFVATATATNDEIIVLNLKDDTGAADVLNISTANPSATTVTSITSLTVDRAASAANNLVETVNLDLAAVDVSTTDGTTIGLLSAAYTQTLNITGAGDATIGSIELRDPTGTGTATINAGAHTGNLTLSAAFKATASDTMAITLGSGTNSVDFSTEALTADSLVATAGTKDTVKIKEAATDVEMTISGVEDLEITGAGASKVISAKNFTNVETIEIYDAAAADNGSDNVKLTNIAAGQAIEMHSTTATKGDWDGDTVTLDAATGVDAIAVTIKGDTKLEGTGIISVDTSSISVTDSNVATATGYSFDQTVVLVGTTITGQTVDVNSLTLSGGGLSAAATNAVLTVSGTTNLDIDTLDATGLASDLNIVALDTGAAAAITMGATANKITIALADAARDAVDIDGGDGKDTLVFANMATGTYRPGATNIEVLDVDTQDAANNTGAVTLHLGDAVSITEVQLDLDLNDENVTVSGADSVAKYVLGGDATATTDVISLGSAATVAVTNEAALGGNNAVQLVTPDATNITFKQGHSSAQTYTSVTAAKATDITLGGTDADTAGTQYAGAITMTTLSGAVATTLAIDTNQGARTINTLTADQLTAITVVGDNAANIGTTGATTTALASIDGSTATGAITVGQGVDFTNAADVKLGTAGDVMNIDILTEANVSISAGDKATSDPADTLNLHGVSNLGLTTINLASTTDQIVQVNGSINSSVQTGFESVNASGLSGSQGVNITGSSEANTLTGTANADVITAGGGIDTVSGGAGADTISFTTSTEAKDTLVLNSATGTDSVTGFTLGAAKDVIQMDDSDLVLFNLDGDAVTGAQAGVAVAGDVTSVIDLSGLGGTENILVLSGTHASVGALYDLIQVGGTAEIALDSTVAEGELLNIAWVDTSGNTNIGYITVDLESTGGSTDHLENAIAHSITTLATFSSTTGFHIDNFDIIA